MAVSKVVGELEYADEIDDLEDFRLREDLDWRERRLAEHLRTISRGVMLVTGDPGSGKDLFGMAFSARQKYFFNRRTLLDFLPKKAYGEYVPFNARVMMTEINKMAKLSGVEGIAETKDQTEYDEFVEQATVHWVLEGEGEALLKNSLLYLSELKRYCYNRNPHNRFNKFIGSINSVWRHLDLLVLGTHVLSREIDKFTYLSYAKIRANCSWCISRRHTAEVRISRGAFAGASDVFVVEGQPLTIYVNGDEPKDWLGGKRVFDLYKSKNYVNLKPVVKKEM